VILWPLVSASRDTILDSFEVLCPEPPHKSLVPSELRPSRLGSGSKPSVVQLGKSMERLKNFPD